MIRLTLVLLVCTQLSAGANAASGDCSLSTKAMASMSPKALTAFVEQQFDQGDYRCGTLAVQAQADRFRRQQGDDRADGFFALRNLALQMNSDVAAPVEARFELVKAAASALRFHAEEADSAEVRFDSMLLAKAGGMYVQQQETGARLDALIAAISLDQRLPAEKRIVKPYGDLVPGNPTPYMDRLAFLAQLIRNDPPLASMRCTIASGTYYNASASRYGDDATALRLQADQLIKLIDAIGADLPPCANVPPKWEWKPLMSAGLARFQADPKDPQSAAVVERSLRLVRSIEGDNARLAQLRFVLSDLLSSKYDRSTTWSVINEMRALSNSLETDIAKEVRESLPRIIKNYGLEN